MPTLGYCPACERLVPIFVFEVDPTGRYIYRPIAHDSEHGKLCRGGAIR